MQKKVKQSSFVIKIKSGGVFIHIKNKYTG